MPSYTPHIQLLSGTTVSNDDLEAACAAVQKQVDEDFGPVWYRGATLSIDPGTAGQWPVTLVNAIPVGISALGYHDVDSGGKPYAIVGLQDCQRAGVPWQTVFSHEVLEMLADPFTDFHAVMSMDNTHGYLTRDEVCDAVETTSYMIDGVSVSNFVYPAWFDSKLPGPWDHMGLIHGPGVILPGGYDSAVPILSLGGMPLIAGDR